MSDELKEGNIYRWRWADDERHADSAPYRSYHCKSQIAIVKNGALIDTYWHGGSDSSYLDPSQVKLTLVAEVTWPTVRAGEQEFYSAGDVVDTRHSNSSSAPIYLRPGATRSAEAVNAVLRRRQEEAEREIRSAMWRMEQIGKMRLLLSEGRLGEVY